MRGENWGQESMGCATAAASLVDKQAKTAITNFLLFTPVPFTLHSNFASWISLCTCLAVHNQAAFHVDTKKKETLEVHILPTMGSWSTVKQAQLCYDVVLEDYLFMYHYTFTNLT